MKPFRIHLLLVFLWIAATLSLRSQPVITQQPQGQTNGVGADVTLSVAVQGTPPFGYQWRAFPTISTFTNIPGAKEPMLLLSNLQISGYRFGVVVTNSEGATTSQLARVVLVYPPGILDPPLTQFSWAGQSVSLGVRFTNATTGMRYRWQWEGADLPSKTNQTLTIAKVQLTNAGDYRIVLINPAGSLTSAVAKITIKTMPPATGVSFVNLTNLEKSITSMMLDHQVPAASLAVMKDGRLVAARCYGYADPENNERTQPDSIFRIASMTKAIVATVALKLAEQGRLSLDEQVFPKMNLPYPTFAGAKVDPRLNAITLRHLLNHTAGFDPATATNPEGRVGFNPVSWTSRCAKDLGIADMLKLTPRDMARWLAGFPLQNNPGDVFVYSNGGYIVASAYQRLV